MSWSQPMASRQFSKPLATLISSFVDSMRFARSRPLSVLLLVCCRLNLWQVKPLRVRLAAVGPLLAPGFVQHVARRAMIVHAHLGRNLPPNSVVADAPSVLPARSHSAISMPHTARISMCAEPSVRRPSAV